MQLPELYLGAISHEDAIDVNSRRFRAILGPVDSERSKSETFSLIALGYFALLTAVVTWPLLPHFLDRVPGFLVADNYEYLWKMWWFKHAILELGQNPLIAPDIFYPAGFQLAHAEITPLHTVVGLPLTAIFGEVATYNLFALLSFVLAGWATFLLVNDLTNQPWAALLAGTIFVLVPYHTVRYGGILPQLSIEGIPIFFLGAERWVRAGRWRWILLAALGFAMAAWATFYYAFGLLLIGPIYLIFRLRGTAGDRKRWLQAGVLGLFVALALLPVSIPYWQLGQELSLEIPLDEVDFWSASLTDYLLPAGLHPIWGNWLRTNLLSVPEGFDQIALEFVLGLGFVTILFAVYGLRHSRRKVASAFLMLAVAAVLLSLGPRLHIGRHPLILPAPESIVDRFHQVMNALGQWSPAAESYQALAEDGLTIPLPDLLLRWFLPPLQGLRAWNRFAVFVSFACAVLAGLGFAAWQKREVVPRTTRRAELLSVIVIALAIFELWPGQIPLQKIEARAVDGWLAEQPEQFTIMELPMLSALSARQMLYTRYHGKRTAFAYGTYFPSWYRQSFPELAGCPEPECLDLLREWDVHFVLLNTETKEGRSELRENLDRSAQLTYIIELDGIRVYRLTPETSRLTPIFNTLSFYH